MVSPDQARERTLQAVDLLLEDIANPSTIADIAVKVGLTKYELSRLFPLVTGKSGPEHLRAARIMKAAEMLREHGRHRIGEVAAAVGYASFSAFCRAFQLETGKLPSEYQEENRPKNFPASFPFPSPPKKHRRGTKR